MNIRTPVLNKITISGNLTKDPQLLLKAPWDSRSGRKMERRDPCSSSRGEGSSVLRRERMSQITLMISHSKERE